MTAPVTRHSRWVTTNTAGADTPAGDDTTAASDLPPLTAEPHRSIGRRHRGPVHLIHTDHPGGIQ